MKAIELRNLSKIYSSGKKAVKNMSLSINEGEVFGFLGPNGAGKTTTVKLLTGILAPTEGECRVFDIEPDKKPDVVHGFSGVLTEHAQMYDGLTGLENLIFYGASFGLDKNESSKRAKQLLKEMNLSGAMERKLGTYSTGMRQRLSLARAIFHRPKVLFLDEPTSGLDPQSVQEVNSLIRRLSKEDGVTVFLCTHQLRYAQEICTSYGLIDAGQLLAVGELNSLRLRVGSDLTVEVDCTSIPDKLPHRIIAENKYLIDVKQRDEVPAIVRQIMQSGADVYQVLIKEPSLEDIYFALTEKGEKDNDK